MIDHRQRKRVLDGDLSALRPLSELSREAADALASTEGPRILVVNKIDRFPSYDRVLELTEAALSAKEAGRPMFDSVFTIAAKSGRGMADLKVRACSRRDVPCADAGLRALGWSRCTTAVCL